MPISVSISAVEWVRHVVFTGVVSDDDVVEIYRAISRCLLDPSMDLLVDATRVRGVAVTPEGLRRLTLAGQGTHSTQGQGAALPRVAVVAADAGVIGAARLYDTFRASESDSSRSSVSRTMADARRWLGLSDEPSVAA